MQLARLLQRVRAADARDAALAASAAAAPAWLGLWPLRRGAAAAAAESAAAVEPAGAGAAAQIEADAAPPTSLQEALAAQGLSHSAVLSVAGWAPAATRAAREKMMGRAAALQDVFGRDHANRMLVVEPSLLNVTERRLRLNLAGLQSALQLSGAQAAALACSHPTVLRSSPTLLRVRYGTLRDLLQLDDATLRSFLLRAPSVLRLADGRLVAQMQWLQDAGRVSRAQVVRAYRSWPQLATTSIAVLKQRHALLQQLLGASDAEMVRVAAVYPNMLARDPNALAANAAALGALLGAGGDAARALLRREPGLLSYNMSTLATRWSYAMQVLRLPRELGPSLLTVNRPLLTLTQQLPGRVEGLRALLGATDDELYALLHKHLAVLRYPTRHAAAKLATFAALLELHPPWAAAARGRACHFRSVRVIMAGWASLYRLAFLVATGQAGSCAPFHALRATAATFARAYPDYAAWLDGYNAAVGPDWAVPLAGSLFPIGRPPPQAAGGARAGAVAPPGASGAAAPAGKGGCGAVVWGKDVESEGGAAGDGMAPWLRELLADGGGGGGGGRSAGRGRSKAGMRQQQAQQREDGEACVEGGQQQPVEAAQDAILAAWLGLPRRDAAALLAARPQLARLGWAAWQARVEAAEALLALLGRAGERGEEGEAGGAENSSGSGGGGGQPAAEALTAEAAFARGATAAAAAHHRHAPPPVGAAAPATGALLAACPEAWASEKFTARCRWLCALAASSPPVMEGLRALPLAALARAPLAPRCAYEALQFLVAERAPRPWLLTPRDLLARHSGWVPPPTFHAAYPGFAAWRAGMRNGAAGAGGGDVA
ncbi:MAG: hypothetical protein J3K34DRAFT_482389 [Monoraphidium minutum]|nr:MAG: hypothetical protein J3K34DRAFT_482389 [Monoraphidium minutum]